MPMNVQRTGIVLRPNPARVVFRPFVPASDERALKITARVIALSESDVEKLLLDVLQEFGDRHQQIQRFFANRFEHVKHHLLTDQPLTYSRKLLIGAYFTQEYALESAALFNPSMVWHPSQEDLPEGTRRFILSLRATGEGHLSSITFRTGAIDPEMRIRLDLTTRYVTVPDLVPNSRFEKALFQRKLIELGMSNRFSEQVLNGLNDQFTLEELRQALQTIGRQNRATQRENEPTLQGMIALAQSNYEIQYSAEQNLSERVIFPVSPTETNGIEDARFVEFHEDDGSRCYYATYTAYDGKVIFPQLLETTDFLHFKMSTLNGPEARNKGFALFPRRINGHYAMLSRQDNENIYLMYSDNLHFWYAKELIAKPSYPWEFVQLGNCGAPIETEAGWLVLTHGVGAMRKYAMGAMLLDRQEPTKVLGRLEEPLLAPNESEREGYVPNVVYSCGALLFRDQLVIPYAMSDYASSFAIVPLSDVLGAMRPTAAV